MDTAIQLQDSKNADNVILFRNANDCIKVMVQTTQRLQTAQPYLTPGPSQLSIENNHTSLPVVEGAELDRSI
jgi:hypothetical protein